MGIQAFDVRIMVRFDRRVLDRAVHSLGLTIGPRMIGLGQLMSYAVLDAGAAEDVEADEDTVRPRPILRQIGESDAIVGEHRVDLMREGKASMACSRKAAAFIFPALS